MRSQFILAFCVGIAIGQTCDTFKEGACPLTELNIVIVDWSEPSTTACQNLCRDTAGCNYFTHFESQCYLLKECASITSCPGCISGSKSPNFDDCPWPPGPVSPTTPPPTSATPTTTSTTTAPPPTTPAPTTTPPIDCGGFFHNYLCNRHDNELAHLEFVQSAKECQAICQERPNCQFFSHYLEEKGEHKGHCYLHWGCQWLEDSKCRLYGESNCPYIPSREANESSIEEDVNDAREELDAQEDDGAEVDEDDLGGRSMPPGSGECGCIAGPKYPDLAACDFDF